LVDCSEQHVCSFIRRLSIKRKLKPPADFITKSPLTAFFLQLLVHLARQPQRGLDHVFRLASRFPPLHLVAHSICPVRGCCRVYSIYIYTIGEDVSTLGETPSV